MRRDDAAPTRYWRHVVSFGRPPEFQVEKWSISDMRKPKVFSGATREEIQGAKWDEAEGCYIGEAAAIEGGAATDELEDDGVEDWDREAAIEGDAATTRAVEDDGAEDWDREEPLVEEVLPEDALDDIDCLQ